MVRERKNEIRIIHRKILLLDERSKKAESVSWCELVAEIRVTGFKEEERERERYFVGRKKILSPSALCLRAVISGGMCAIVTLHVIPIHMLYRPGTRNSLQ